MNVSERASNVKPISETGTPGELKPIPTSEFQPTFHIVHRFHMPFRLDLQKEKTGIHSAGFAERVRFELTVRFPVHTLSRRAS